MIAELGHFILALALSVAVVQTVLGLWPARGGQDRFAAPVRTAAITQAALVVAAFALLTMLFIRSDFSVALVATHSHSAKPLLYKISGVWGNHEGSMLLWIVILSLYGVMATATKRTAPERLITHTLAVQGLIAAAFISFTLFTSNPFARLEMPVHEGAGLTPILQDPALAIHPPFLYAGYVGFSLTYALAIAALAGGALEGAAARLMRAWTLLAWSLLTIGIALGSWWAYYELGWGGFWFWDPVENASFMPWLMAIALLHSAAVSEQREALKNWTLLLAILTFGLALAGAFLVRSGVLTSVHSFATDPTRGLYLLLILFAFTGGGLLLFALRTRYLEGGSPLAPLSREGALALNNLFLTSGTATVLIGTLYPLVLEALDWGQISVGPPYFALTFLPMMILPGLIIPFGPLLAWREADIPSATRRLTSAGLIALAAGLVMGIMTSDAPFAAALGFGIAIWLIIGAAVEPLSLVARRLYRIPSAVWARTLAHGGLGILAIGITAATLWQSERLEVMQPGNTLSLAGYTLTLTGIKDVTGPNYTAQQARLTVTRDSLPIATLMPERRLYRSQQTITTEADVLTLWRGDLYMVMGEAAEDGRVFRVYFKPLISFIWIGAGLIAAGGFTAFILRYKRSRKVAYP